LRLVYDPGTEGFPVGVPPPSAVLAGGAQADREREIICCILSTAITAKGLSLMMMMMVLH